MGTSKFRHRHVHNASLVIKMMHLFDCIRSVPRLCAVSKCVMELVNVYIFVLLSEVAIFTFIAQVMVVWQSSYCLQTACEQLTVMWLTFLCNMKKQRPPKILINKKIEKSPSYMHYTVTHLLRRKYQCLLSIISNQLWAFLCRARFVLYANLPAGDLDGSDWISDKPIIEKCLMYDWLLD